MDIGIDGIAKDEQVARFIEDNEAVRGIADIDVDNDID